MTVNGGSGAMQIRHSSLRNQLKGKYNLLEIAVFLEIYMSNGTPAGGSTINQ